MQQQNRARLSPLRYYTFSGPVQNFQLQDTCLLLISLSPFTRAQAYTTFTVDALIGAVICPAFELGTNVGNLNPHRGRRRCQLASEKADFKNRHAALHGCVTQNSVQGPAVPSRWYLTWASSWSQRLTLTQDGPITTMSGSAP